MDVPALLRSDRGMTRLESNILMGILVVTVVIGAAVLIRTYSSAVGETEHATVQDGHPFQHSAVATAPVAVNVVAAGTIAQPLPDAADDVDACADLAGMQPTGFDCSLPAVVPALDVAASHVKGRYLCADEANYELVGGQTEEPDKVCILKSVRRASS